MKLQNYNEGKLVVTTVLLLALLYFLLQMLWLVSLLLLK